MQRSNLVRTIVTQGALGLALAASLLATPAPSFAQRVAGTGQLSLAVEAQADTASRSDGVDTYKVTMVNRSSGSVEGITVRVPIAAGYTLAGASFTQDDAWVAQNGAGAATIRFEQLRGIGDTVVATLRFTGPSDAASNALTERVNASWSKDDKTVTATSNQPGITSFTLATSRTGQAITFSGNAFASNEPVNFWYTNANGVSVPLVLKDGQLGVEPVHDKGDEKKTYGLSLTASPEGLSKATLNTAGLPAGSYTFSARGSWSGVTASAPFVVE